MNKKMIDAFHATTHPIKATDLERIVNCRDPKLMKNGVRMLQDYWGTYDMQRHYENYSVGTLIDDALYGLGLAINKDEYQNADGFKIFKAILLEHLSK